MFGAPVFRRVTPFLFKRIAAAFLALLLCLAAVPLSAQAEGETDYSYTYPENYGGVIDPLVPYDPLLAQDGVMPEDRHTENTNTPAPRSPLLRAAPQMVAANSSYPRVLLSTSHTSVDVVFFGNYCVYDTEGTPVFIPQTGAVYNFSYANGMVTVSSCGAPLFSAAQFQIKEHTPPEGKSNYFTLYNERYGVNLSYNGSLAAYAQIDGNQGVYLVNRVYMDDYLCGVVPGEIGDGFGAAALQAQAIAARNYAYKAVTSALCYDLVDTSKDQVYKGITYAPNTTAAVAATEKLLLTYQGTVVEVFYSASNGGVTEIPSHRWTAQTVIPAYIEVKTDAYDLKYSKQYGTNDYLEEVTVPKTVPMTGGALNGFLKAVLKNAYALTDQEADSISLTAFSLSADCADESFRAIYVQNKGGAAEFCSHFANLTLTWTGSYTKGGSPVVVDGTVPVVVTASALENSVYGFTNNKLESFWLIDNTTEGTYTIRHARYGHGIGMSQIGARQMAAENKTVFEILTFYYPNTSLTVGANFTDRETLTALPALTSRPLAVVSDAFVYTRPYTDSLQLGVARKGSSLTVTGEKDDYYIVTFEGKTGYAAKSAFALSFANVSIVNVTTSCNVRSEPSSAGGSATIVGSAALGANYALLDAYTAPGWYKINYNGQAAYVSSWYAIPAQSMGASIADYAITVTPPTGYTDAVLWVDGVAVPAVAANGIFTATVHNTSAKTVVMYKLKPSGTMQEMYAWTLSYAVGSGYTATALPSAIQNLLTYHGCAVRVTGNTGLRFISGIGQSARTQLLSGAGAGGFKLVEYGTVVMRDISYGVYPFVKGGYDTKFGRSYWGSANDYYIKIDGGRIQFASVMVNIQPANYNTYYGFRSYAILQKDGVQYIFYGGQVARSMYYVCKQVLDANEFPVGSSAYNFVYNIVATVEGNG
ncbi:MAG TPA: SpoIID/LytB domain-containing protein [Clostridia bacterium]|nr:SpoIID/LytB domain-containing protein [Clostridia bacterium]